MRFLFEHSPLLPSRRISSRVVMHAVGQAGAQQGWLLCGGQRHPCAFGRGGIGVKKREGDGVTPVGVFPLRAALLTRLSFAPPCSRLPILRVGVRAGWCDDVRHARRYNRSIALPTRCSHEVLRRGDGVYDLLLVLGYNDAPIFVGRGSAIFVHATASKELPYKPTEGCVAVRGEVLRGLLPKLRRGALMKIEVRR